MGSADDIWQLLVNYWPVLLGNALEWYEFAVYGSWTFPDFLGCRVGNDASPEFTEQKVLIANADIFQLNSPFLRSTKKT